MPYVPLFIDTGDSRVDAIFRGIIEEQLQEAHWLLATACPDTSRNPSFHKATAMLLLGTIAASSALASFAKPGHKRKTDRADFINWAVKYFPWDQVHIKDDQFRTMRELPSIAAESMYETFRCPIFHTAGMVHVSLPIAELSKIHPRTLDMLENEKDVEELAKQQTFLGGQLLSLEYNRAVLSLDALYWCVRRGRRNACGRSCGCERYRRSHALTDADMANYLSTKRQAG